MRLVGVTGLVAALSALTLVLWASPSIAANNTSQRVALIPGPGPIPAQGLNGIMPTSSYVTGDPSEQFSSFSFSDVSLDQITPTTLAKYDTVALVQVPSGSLSAPAKAALAQFVANGGKLLLHDADETKGNDYSWLLGGPYTTQVAASCIDCGSQSPLGGLAGMSTILTNSGIISSNPADASHVDLSDLYTYTDQGDANLLQSTDPRWKTLVQGNRGADSGVVIAYARSGNGLIIYNGFDTDFINTTATDRPRCAGFPTSKPYYCPAGKHPEKDWLAHMWYSELAQAWGSDAGIPAATPVVGIGTATSSGSAGLPSPPTTGHACVARRNLRLKLSRFTHVRHRKIVQVDVYVSGKHRFRERGHFGNRTLGRLPRHGRYTVTVIATTKRGYHLIAKRRYRSC
jgi:hypothetical protein